MAGGAARPTLTSPWSARRLLTAWERLRKQHRKQEFDRAELSAFSVNPQSQCDLLSRQIDSGSYRPGGLRPMALGKAGGGSRLLLVPSLHDRVVQAAVAMWLSDTCDATLADQSYAYRPGRSVRLACERVQQWVDAGHTWVVHSDIRAFFDEVDHARLIAVLKRQPWWGNRIAALIRSWLRMEITPDAATEFDAPACLCRGLPQGSPASPVLSNLFLDVLDRNLQQQDISFVRYADDVILLATTGEQARLWLAVLEQALKTLGLTLHTDKTVICRAQDGFTFLGQAFPLVRGGEDRSDGPPHDAGVAGRGGTFALPATLGSQAGAATASLNGAYAPPSPEIEGEEDTGRTETTTDEPLLRTLYLLESQVALNRQGDTLVVERPTGAASRIPAARVHQILAFGAVNFTSGAIALCLEKSIPVMLLSGRGRHFGVIDPLRLENVKLQQAQFAAMAQAQLALQIARAWVCGKIANSHLMLRRLARRHFLPKLDEHLFHLRTQRRSAERAESRDSLRAHEGAAAAEYFKAIGSLVPEEWRFTGRKRRPPPDPVNSMLSYGYTVLYYNMLTLILARGLNPHVGFYHVQRSGRHALVSDMIEEFRALTVDAVVLDLVLNRRLIPDHFNWPERPGDACLMSDAARRSLIHALERKFNAVMRQPGTQTPLDTRRIMDMQVLQLCAMLQGRASAYIPFVPR